MNIRKVMAATAVGAMTLVPLAACSSDEPESTTSEATSEVMSEESTTAEAEPVAQVDDLSNGVDTAVALDTGFTDALTTLGLTPGTVGGAALTDGSLIFPITGGEVTYYEPGSIDGPYVQGEIMHDGSGLSLTAGDTVVELTDFVIDPGTSELMGTATVNGEVAAEDAVIFDLDGSTLQPLQTEGDNAILQGTQVLISETAAGLLNDTFQTDAVTPGLLVGTATITIATA